MLFVGLVAALGVSWGASAFDGAPPERPFRPERARAVLGDAQRVLRPAAPATARQIDRLVSAAEVITAQESSRPVWDRIPGRSQAAWTRALILARESVAEVRRRQTSLAESWTTLASAADREVRQALVQSNEAGVGRREISAAQQAAHKLRLARTFAASGDYSRAIGEAEQARHFARTVATSFGELHARFSDPRNLRRWRTMVEQTIARSKRERTTVLVVDKLKRRLHVYASGQRVATYEAELGAKGLRQKLHSGDQATPEGLYKVTEVRNVGRTKYYKALMLDYPNSEDRARYAHGRKTGQVPLRAGIGSLIEIHGEGGQGRDWTDGCVALANGDMDKVFARARIGTPVTIVGTY